METSDGWQRAWREGFAPLLSTPALEALRDGLAANDPALLQNVIASPLDLRGAPCDGACAIAYAIWKGEQIVLAEKVRDRFYEVCCKVRGRLDISYGDNLFIDWFDRTLREGCFPILRAEVEHELARRKEATA